MKPSPIPVLDRRRSGVLLHPTSLLNGNGALGAVGREFIDWLAAARFSVWQVLPLGPVGADGSPYWSRADGAFNIQLIDWREAPQMGDLAAKFAAFNRDNASWLNDYVLFEALSREQNQSPWWLWPEALRNREPDAMRDAQQRLGPALERARYEQWVAALQWARLRRHAHARGVRLFGDLPIYVAPDSATVWSQQAQFQLDADGRATAVAGVPPDYFSADGQLWGNPLYDWQQGQRDGFSLWRQRLQWMLQRFDLVRIDHFRGLCACWAVPATAATAREGSWQAAPGHELLQRLKQHFGQLPLVAEDLGVITDDVVALRRAFDLPGMRVLQFGFDGNGANPHLPHEHERGTIAYSGTHDNNTTLGWFRMLDPLTRERVTDYAGTEMAAMPLPLLRVVLASVAQLAILPMQDLLGLGAEARFNTPGTISGNWSWRLPADSLNDDLARQWSALNSVYGRADSSV
jgi:4-alpha-glucanotransferase